MLLDKVEDMGDLQRNAGVLAGNIYIKLMS